MTLTEEVRNQIIDDILAGKGATSIAREREVSRSVVSVIKRELYAGPKGMVLRKLAEHALKTGDDLSLLPAGMRIASTLKKNGIDDLDEAEKGATYLEVWLESRGVDIDAKTAIKAKAEAKQMADKLGVPVDNIVPKLDELGGVTHEMNEKLAALNKKTADATARYENALAVAGLVLGFIKNAKRFDTELRTRGHGIEVAPMLLEILEVINRSSLTIYDLLAHAVDFSAKMKEKKELDGNVQWLKVHVDYYWRLLQSHKELAQKTLEYDMSGITPDDIDKHLDKVTRRALQKGITKREAFLEIVNEEPDGADKHSHFGFDPSAVPAASPHAPGPASSKASTPEPEPLPTKVAGTTASTPRDSRRIIVNARDPYQAIEVHVPPTGTIVADFDQLLRDGGH